LSINRSARGYQNPSPKLGGGEPLFTCAFIDTNPISSLNNKGHNYFLSQNPYELNSYAGFGEVYYNFASDLKLTGGLRWTEDRKRFTDIPSEVITNGYGYPVTAVVNQQWDKLTGRAAANWTPKFDFTDQTLIYGSYTRGYKAGGANPPGAVLDTLEVANITEPVHPLTFRPEFINAYELGSKNTLLDGALTLNGDVFYYDYKDYQISEIVDRTSINLNFSATVKGAELETSWEPAPGLKFSFAGGYEDTRVNNGQSAIDLMDRTDAAHHPDWMVVKPFVTQTSNCILPIYVVRAIYESVDITESLINPSVFSCANAYVNNWDPMTFAPYVAKPTGITAVFEGYSALIPSGYPGFDPTNPAYNGGEGFAKPLGGNQLPNAPHFTTSLSGEYTLPVSEDWAATLHSDFYWQSQSFARVFNDRPYDKIRGYSNVNLALILTSASGWQVMGYLKNVFDTTAITGDFLNSDDTGLTTNVFLTDPRLYGVRVTKNF
jgi:iron complex outermembrane receptor protein